MGTCYNRLAKAVLTSTHNLCFGAKIRKIGIPLHTPVLLYKSWVQGGIYFTDMVCRQKEEPELSSVKGIPPSSFLFSAYTCIMMYYAPVICNHCSPTYGKGGDYDFHLSVPCYEPYSQGANWRSKLCPLPLLSQ